MPKVRSLDFVLLETSIFGVSRGYTGRFIGSRISWILGILNLCHSLIVAYSILFVSQKYFNVDDQLSINFIVRKVHLAITLFMAVTMQARCLLRRQKIVPMERELYRLYELSTWNGDIFGCIARIVLYLGWLILFESLPVYAENWDGNMNWRILYTLYYWSTFVSTATSEFISQIMLLLQHEFQVLCKIAEGLATRQDHGITKLRVLNRRHASLFALSNTVAQFTGIDSLLLIESERIFILISILIVINFNSVTSQHWTKNLLDCGFLSYSVERIIHNCFRGHRIIMEANRFSSTLDVIDPMDLENDEFFTELQIFRKQVKLRKLHFDCNRSVKLDMKRIVHILKNLLTLSIILVQLTTDLSIGASKPAYGTKAENVSEYFPNFSDIHSNSSTLGTK